jgi:hypothetical protein
VIGKEAEEVMDDVWDAALKRVGALREILASTE